ncbi:DUF4145 domain-containing protein [Nostoc parmelioides]|uniref:DUF4145 domain-containing protein n=1 Tax=Nostoc parmelioides FACHB-3921 TaxID=2692909 RepID=A0ABR8BNF7_9NOSO|nr:DUF4145 domain-containing protein [Nostoc parmelioides]MBD2255647.1 DUF4145 domain-containing protein [Nostoc parmelioides FACHB-3921]
MKKDKILTCLTCKAFVNAEEINNYTIEIHDEYPLATTNGEMLITFNKYSFFKCPKCFKPLVTCTEYDNEPSSEDKLTILYPTSNKTISSEVPTYIKKAFDEAILCFNSNAFTASVIMCRKTVEGICKERGIEKNTLQKKLEIMKEEGIIDQNLYDWANILRLAGNDAAHDLDVVFDIADAQDIVDFTYAIIDYIFTYRKKFESFKKRRQKQENEEKIKG